MMCPERADQLVLLKAEDETRLIAPWRECIVGVFAGGNRPGIQFTHKSLRAARRRALARGAEPHSETVCPGHAAEKLRVVWVLAGRYACRIKQTVFKEDIGYRRITLKEIGTRILEHAITEGETTGRTEEASLPVLVDVTASVENTILEQRVAEIVAGLALGEFQLAVSDNEVIGAVVDIESNSSLPLAHVVIFQGHVCP